ncbi:unnamed protein product [Brugia timori]|uniref:Prim-Pol domain-containing protein n=1 Tax=Brugia timori TaxID=42155 RepID=A0A0R3Q2X5_9BILA|nr:unnamed protein product [Brugia timori]
MASTSEQWGARPEDWDHFDLVLGLGCDLLPVVSNPGAVIDKDSKLKELGKTPSLYNRQRQVTGIAGWTDQQSSDKDITRWAAEPDYGICVQTREVRALDIDVPDAALAGVICEFIAEQGLPELPVRRRDNSGKCLLAFRLAGEFAKRKMVVDGGIIEFLANGQQFIAVGTHPSGARYAWQGGLPWEIPELTEDQFDTLWSALAERFATEEVRSAGAVVPRKRGDNVQVADPVAAYLEENDLVLSKARDGSLVVQCPWEDQHTTGNTGDGSTVWFPAGMNGYDRGHFKCLHGHCDGRNDSDFFTAIGYVEDISEDFEPLPVVVRADGKAEKPLPPFERDKSGEILARVNNVAMALRRPDFTGMEIRFDKFKDEIVWCPDGAQGEWRAFKDADYVRLRITMERRGFKPIGRDLIRDVVLMVADENAFDTAIMWLSDLKWDGVPRVQTFLSDHFGVEPSDYHKAVSLYMWTALAGRVMEPGVKADMVPVLVGAQGLRKSTAVAAIAPDVNFFCEISFGDKETDLSRRMRGKLVGEISELRGLMTREEESIKAFITRTHEEWVPKFREFQTTFPRRLLFIGTTNKNEFLADETGHRRWLPVTVGKVDVDSIVAVRDQLWAEGRELFKKNQIMFTTAEDLAKEVHKDHIVTDAWDDVIKDWLNTEDALTGQKPADQYGINLQEVLTDALRFDAKSINRREELRAASVLRRLGYEKVDARLNGSVRKIWRKA